GCLARLRTDIEPLHMRGHAAHPGEAHAQLLVGDRVETVPVAVRRVEVAVLPPRRRPDVAAVSPPALRKAKDAPCGRPVDPLDHRTLRVWIVCRVCHLEFERSFTP